MSSVLVKFPNGLEKTINISENDTADSLRKLIKEKCKIINEDFKVTYGGKEILGTSTLTDYNVFSINKKPTLNIIDAAIKGGF